MVNVALKRYEAASSNVLRLLLKSSSGLQPLAAAPSTTVLDAKHCCSSNVAVRADLSLTTYSAQPTHFTANTGPQSARQFSDTQRASTHGECPRCHKYYAHTPSHQRKRRVITSHMLQVARGVVTVAPQNSYEIVFKIG